MTDLASGQRFFSRDALFHAGGAIIPRGYLSCRRCCITKSAAYDVVDALKHVLLALGDGGIGSLDIIKKRVLHAKSAKMHVLRQRLSFQEKK